MARFEMSGLDPIVEEMRRLGEESGAVATEMLMAGAEAVKQAWQRAADEYDHRVTSDMINSIGYPRGPQRVGDILSIDIYPQGKDRHGVRNAEKAFILHYGSSKLYGSRWIDAADRYSGETVVPAMAEIWDRFVKG